MVTRTTNRAPSAPRFNRSARTIGDLGAMGPSFASVGASGGVADVTFEAIGRLGTALVDQDIKNQVESVTQKATQAGQVEAARAFVANDAVKLRADETVAAAAFNRSLQTGYLEELDLGLRQRTAELVREHGADPEAFAKAYGDEVAAMRANLPHSWQPAFDRATQRKGMEVMDKVTAKALSNAANEANATHMQASDTYMAEMADALRRGDVETAQGSQAQALASIDARTDLSPQAKVKTAAIVEREWQRHSVLGEFDGALAEGPESAAAFISVFEQSDAIKDPDARARVAGEMSAKLRDVLNEQNAQIKERDAGQKSTNAVNISSLEINVSRGQAGHADIEEADRNGLFEFDTKARTRIYKAADAKAKKRQDDADLVVMGAAFVTGEAVADAKNPEHIKAADAQFQSAVAPTIQGQDASTIAANVSSFIASTGVIPTKVKGTLRAHLSGGNPEQIAMSADIVARIEETRPKALDVFARGDLALAQKVNKLVRAGVTPEDAVTRAREAIDPTNEVVRVARKAERKTEKYSDSYGDWIENAVNPTGFLDFVPFGPSNDVSLDDTRGASLQAQAEFGALFEDWHDRTGDKDIAKANALREFSRTWGASAVNGELNLMKYPPEAYYGLASSGLSGEANDADGAWMREQLLADVGAAGMWDPDVPLDGRVRMEADSQTAREVGAGMAPTYPVFVMDAQGVYQPLQDGQGGVLRWYPQADRDGKVQVARFKRELAAQNDSGPMTLDNMRDRVQDAAKAGGGDAVR